MMHSNHGFSLLSLCVYMALSTCIVALGMQFVYRAYQHNKDDSADIARCIDVYTVHDFFMRELRTAPHERDKWSLFGSNAIGWQQNDEEITWCFTHNATRLVRTYKRHGMTKKNSNVVLCNIAGGSFGLQTDGVHVASITLHLATSDNKKGKNATASSYCFYGCY